MLLVAYQFQVGHNLQIKNRFEFFVEKEKGVVYFFLVVKRISLSKLRLKNCKCCNSIPQT